MSGSVWLYAVVSTEGQAETIDHQRAWANDVALAQGWTISREFVGVSSGNVGTRKLLLELLDALRQTSKPQRPSRILMIRLDRTGRGIGIDSLAAIAEIRQLGVMIHTREDGDVKIERAADTLVPFMRVLTGALENEARSDKWKAVHARRRAAGLHVGSVPFGVVLVDGRATPYEPEATVVRDLFRRAAGGWGYTRLARWAAQRARTKRLDDGTDKPYRWAPSTVKSLLTSKTLRGLVVAEDLCDAALAARAADFKTRSTQRWPWPLVGAVRCTCGTMLRGHTAGERAHPIRYMICFNLEHGRPYPAHRADKLEASFLSLLRDLAATPDLFAERQTATHLASLQSQKTALQAQLAELDKRRAKAWSLAENDVLTGPQLRVRLDEVDVDRAGAREQLAEVERELVRASESLPKLSQISSALTLLAATWEQRTVDEQRELAKAIASLPSVGGLFCDHRLKHQLLLGAKLEQTDAASSVPPCERMFPGERLLALLRSLRDGCSDARRLSRPCRGPDLRSAADGLGRDRNLSGLDAPRAAPLTHKQRH